MKRLSEVLKRLQDALIRGDEAMIESLGSTDFRSYSFSGLNLNPYHLSESYSGNWPVDFSPLRLAAERGHLEDKGEVYLQFIRSAANNYSREVQEDALAAAIAMGSYKSTETLLESMPPPSNPERHFRLAVSTGESTIVQLLKKKIPTFELTEQLHEEFLNIAAKHGNEDLIDVIHRDMPKSSSTNSFFPPSVLQSIALNGNLHLYERFESQIATRPLYEPQDYHLRYIECPLHIQQVYSPLQIAAENGHNELVKAFLERRTPLIVVKNEGYDFEHILLHRNPKSPEIIRASALSAVYHNQELTFRMFMETLHFKDSFLQEALMLAVRRASTVIIDLILKQDKGSVNIGAAATYAKALEFTAIAERLMLADRERGDRRRGRPAMVKIV